MTILEKIDNYLNEKDLNFKSELEQKISERKKIAEQMDKIVDDGGRIPENDPLSVKYSKLTARINYLNKDKKEDNNIKKCEHCGVKLLQIDSQERGICNTCYKSGKRKIKK